MFTGIIEEVGSVRRLIPHQAGARLEIACSRVISDAVPGSSIAVNGVCLTAIEIGTDHVAVDLAPETIARSNLGELAEGAIVNLERPLTLSARLSGHMVQGHVDSTGELLSIAPLGDGNWWLRVRVHPDAARYMVHKGSVTLDGVSLTIASLENGTIGIAIIPHTFENTNLRGRIPGDRINVETDLIAKYIEKLLPPR